MFFFFLLILEVCPTASSCEKSLDKPSQAVAESSHFVQRGTAASYRVFFQSEIGNFSNLVPHPEVGLHDTSDIYTQVL